MVPRKMRLSIEDIRNRILTCKKCETMNAGQRRVPGVGVLTPSVFFVGEAPGRLGADKTGVPFTLDRSGKLLEEMMRMIGLSTHRDVYISNVVKCNPRSESGRNRHPSIEEIENCREHLLAELEVIEPRILVPLGKLASDQLLGLGKCMRQISGHMSAHESYGSVLPLYHPGYVVRGNYTVDRYRQDFRRLKKLLKEKTLSS
jgi:DNA polymerase